MAFLILLFLLPLLAADTVNQCKVVVHLGHTNNDRVIRCWNITDGSNWYGGGTRDSPLWPFQKEEDTIGFKAAVTGGNDGTTNSVNSRFWMSSSGLAIIADDDVPLFVSSKSFNSVDSLCLGAFYLYPYYNPGTIPPKLSYTQCESPSTDSVNLTEFYLGVRHKVFRLPEGLPDESLMRLPFWTMNKRFSRPRTSDILAFAINISSFMKQVRQATTSSGILHINNWELCEGDFQFASSQINDPKTLIAKVRSLGLHIALQIHPFINPKCPGFEEARQRRYLVRNNTANYQPLQGKWMGDPMYVIDFTNDDAVAWWTARLNSLKQKYGISSFVFDGGVSSVFTSPFILSNTLSLQPDIFTTRYIEAAAKFGKLSVVTSAWQTQRLPLFVRGSRLQDVGLGDTDSLKGEIPNLLRMGLNGYPFVMPEVVGGSYGHEQPPKAVFIRWLQLSTFLPALHLRFGPWDYDTGVVDMALKMFQLRAQFEDYLIEVAQEATVDGSPMIRPLWWASPNDKTAQIISDQFLVGDKLMVAPVVDTIDEDQTQPTNRNIYLPEGKWIDMNNSTYDGSKWLTNYKVHLNQLAYFRRL